MSLHPHPDSPRRTAFVLALLFGLMLALPASAAETANRTVGWAPPAANTLTHTAGPVGSAHPTIPSPGPPLAAWQLFVMNRSRMIQVAVVFLAIGIFILTRGRWK